jgi:hypothetical protein
MKESETAKAAKRLYEATEKEQEHVTDEALLRQADGCMIFYTWVRYGASGPSRYASTVAFHQRKNRAYAALAHAKRDGMNGERSG